MGSGLRAVLAGLALQEDSSGQPPGRGFPPHPSLLSPRIGFFTTVKKKKFFFFPQTKINKQKTPKEVVLPAQLGLARCCTLPLNRNCKAWPATSWFSRSSRRSDSPAAGWEPELAPALRAPSQSFRPRSVGWARGAWAAACPCAPRGGGQGGPRHRPRPFHGALRGRGRKTPAVPRESRGWGEPHWGGWEGGKGGGGSPRGTGEGGGGEEGERRSGETGSQRGIRRPQDGALSGDPVGGAAEGIPVEVRGRGDAKWREGPEP